MYGVANFREATATISRGNVNRIDRASPEFQFTAVGQAEGRGRKWDQRTLKGAADYCAARTRA